MVHGAGPPDRGASIPEYSPKAPGFVRCRDGGIDSSRMAPRAPAAAHLPGRPPPLFRGPIRYPLAGAFRVHRATGLAYGRAGAAVRARVLLAVVRGSVWQADALFPQVRPRHGIQPGRLVGADARAAIGPVGSTGSLAGRIAPPRWHARTHPSRHGRAWGRTF